MTMNLLPTLGIILVMLIVRIECKTNVAVVAHRGASGYLPEHTLEAKVAAFVMNSDYIEQDVVLTKDYVPIVIHDVYLDTTTDVSLKFNKTRARNDSRYYAIDFTFDEIKTLNVTERVVGANRLNESIYANRFPIWKSNFKIHSLNEEIELIQGMQKSMKSIINKTIGLYVEIKQPYFHFKNNKTNISEIVLSVLARYGYKTYADPVIVQCFDPYELSRIRHTLGSSLKLVQLLQSANSLIEEPFIDYGYWNSEIGLKQIKTFANGIGPEKDQLVVTDSSNRYYHPSDLVYYARSLQLFIHPYTFRVDSLPSYVNNFDELLNIFINDIKVDALFTDFPDVIIQYNEKLTSKSSILKMSSYFYSFMIMSLILFQFY